MAKAAAKKSASGSAKGKANANAKSATGRKATAKAKPAAKPKKATGGTSSSKPRSDNAADALIGLIESPLVADLLAAAVTAAAATMLEHRLKSRSGKNSSMVKAVGVAAATAVGRHLAEEFDEIRRSAASREPKST